MNFFNGRKPREIGQLRTDYSPPESMQQLFQSVEDMTERMKVEEPPPAKINHLDEIAHHLRQLTWSEMVTLTQAINAEPAVVHTWATEYRGE